VLCGFKRRASEILFAQLSKNMTDDDSAISSVFQFEYNALTPVQQKRWRILTSPLMTQRWWRSLLFDGCVVAGGAALFLVDETQCIGDVGDIDVWVPLKGADKQSLIALYVKTLIKHCKSRNLDVSHRITTSIATVTTSLMTIQFIASRNESAETILQKFDYDVVQCAVLTDGQNQIGTVVSRAAKQCHIDRVVKFQNVRPWLYARHPVGKREEIRRMHEDSRTRKLERKGFHVGQLPDNFIVPQQHQCDRTHDKRRKYIMHFVDTVLSNRDIATLESMICFDRGAIQNYVLEHDGDRTTCNSIVGMQQNTAEKQAATIDDNSLWNWQRVKTCWRDNKRRTCHFAFLSAKKRYESSAATDRKVFYALRNLKMLGDASFSLRQVFNSVWSDANKVGEVDPFYFTMITSEPVTIETLLRDIKRFFGIIC